MKINYDFDQKNNWRNMVWNQLSERVTVHPKNAIVLYLAAKNDLDRSVALKKGFRNENLIAVDRSQEVVERIRSEGNLALNADMENIVDCWPAHTPVSAIVGDFVCGLVPTVVKMSCELPFKLAFRQCVTCFNLMRGRENKAHRSMEVLHLLGSGSVSFYIWRGRE